MRAWKAACRNPTKKEYSRQFIFSTEPSAFLEATWKNGATDKIAQITVGEYFELKKQRENKASHGSRGGDRFSVARTVRVSP